MKASDFIVPTTEKGWKTNAPEVVNPEKLVAIAGTKVTCQKCKDTIGRLSVPIYSGMRIPAAAIEFERHQVKHSNEKAECRRCGAPYLKHFIQHGLKTKLHTELGWI